MEKIELSPLVFKPYLKSVIWGGSKICAYKGIPQQNDHIGESWEISAVPGHESVVAEGQYAGLTLTQLISKFGEQLLGKNVMSRYNGKFPLLIKIIDANDNLSVQVHPDDALAMKRHHCLGKTEMWYIIASEPDAKIYSGLNVEMTPKEYKEKVADGSFAQTLAVHDSNPGDVFFLPAGRVHAIGAGNLLAEIQESSDITYRIYDYDRRDADGNPRELHTELAKDAIDFSLVNEYKSPSVSNEIKDAEIVKCDHFCTHRLLVDGEIKLNYDDSSFSVIICIDGNATIVSNTGEMSLKAGQTVLIPAAMTSFILRGKATMLVSRS